MLLLDEISLSLDFIEAKLGTDGVAALNTHKMRQHLNLSLQKAPPPSPSHLHSLASVQRVCCCVRFRREPIKPTGVCAQCVCNFLHKMASLPGVKG